jgi:hypothetical protein
MVNGPAWQRLCGSPQNRGLKEPGGTGRQRTRGDLLSIPRRSIATTTMLVTRRRDVWARRGPGPAALLHSAKPDSCFDGSGSRHRRGGKALETRNTCTLLALTVALVVASFTPAGATASESGNNATVADEADPAAQYLMARYNVSREEADRRLVLQQDAAELDERLAARHGPVFAGLWIDQQNGRVVVAATERSREFEQDSQLAHGGEVHHVVAHRTAESLQRKQAELRNLLASGQAVALNLEQNQIDVFTAGMPLPERAEEYMSRTPEAFTRSDIAVNDRPEACLFPYCDAPLRAGVGITVSGTLQCTSAFNVKSKSDNKPYIMTAGHCVDAFAASTVWGTRFANGEAHNIGPRHNDTFPSVDAAILRIDNPSGWNPAATTVVWAANGLSQNDAYSIQDYAVAALNAVVCHSGATTRSKCGTVRELSYDTTYGASDVVVVEPDACTDGGDSGGPWWANARAYGIHSGSGSRTYGCVSYYTRIDTAMSGLGVRLKTTTNP